MGDSAPATNESECPEGAMGDSASATRRCVPPSNPNREFDDRLRSSHPATRRCAPPSNPNRGWREVRAGGHLSARSSSSRFGLLGGGWIISDRQAHLDTIALGPTAGQSQSRRMCLVPVGGAFQPRCVSPVGGASAPIFLWERHSAPHVALNQTESALKGLPQTALHGAIGAE